MPTFGPVNRKTLIPCFRRLGFAGPYSGGKHQFMVRGTITVRIPNPHQGDIGQELLARILRQAGVSKSEWNSV